MEEEEYTPLEKMTPEEVFALWPNLTADNHQIKSEPIKYYNCVAWISGEKAKRIDFYRNEKGEINEDQSSEPYVQYFFTLGFVECNSPEYEKGFEKIALYEDRWGNFTHVARQLSEDIWTSKLGYLEDIEHSTLEALEGKKRDQYGKAFRYMKRKL